ncbi:hypothetical protein [Mangrovibacillus cuniculi]|uniref:Uncharacterized protein n=1 Tax=Mangrovibacillus cuniculi TaxID=2593652 RepID=A0A7S8HFI4_9BACI|nr:hypothetical protein [Mangrovibacillus cuniculi]QPC46868.1 hypothetical protein G8O30_07790 [Mangrovibacillus cuniculi]
MRKLTVLLIILVGILVSCDSDEISVQPTLPSEDQKELENPIWNPFKLQESHQLNFISWGKNDNLLVTTTGSNTIITEYNAQTEETRQIYQTDSFIQSVNYYEQSERYVIVESPQRMKLK